MKSFLNRMKFIALPALLPMAMYAQDKAAAPADHSIWGNAVFMTMLCVIILLFIIIAGLAELVKGAAKYQATKKGNGGKNISTILLLLFLFSPLFASAAVTPEPADYTYWGMGAMLFYSMLTVIIFELFILFMLLWVGNSMLNVKEEKVTRALKEKKPVPSFMEKINASVAVQEEAAIMFDHDYDGIRELDNDLPPWWKYGFYATVVFALIYLIHFHVLHTGMSSREEYEAAVKQGEADVAAYKLTAKDLVDENNVVQLKDAASIAEGSRIFHENCVACHGEKGEGKEGLGPNFCDDYWLHGGSMHDVFRSIKYGWTDKGMKSWQQDLKPSEIQLVASFVKSLRGSNPPNAKAKQGEYYVDADAVPLKDTMPKSDSLQPKADSVK